MKRVVSFLVFVVSVVPIPALAEPTEPTLPTEDEHAGVSRAAAIEAFVKDCHATLQATAWVEGDEVVGPECQALDVEQNCSPDAFGCWDAFGECQVACQPGCSRCQDECAGPCDTCKAGCKAGDASCIRKCAEARADCRGGCMDGLRKCQGPTCQFAENECVKAGTAKLKACNRESCEAYGECVWETADGDAGKAEAVCQKKVKGLNDFCRDICGSYGGMAFDIMPEDEGPPAVEEGLEKKCTKAAQCPDDYVKLVPYLGAFCAGALDDRSLQVLVEDVREGPISKRSMSLVFNAYGAMYGYEFKKEKWMNGFFYGDGAWLPATCRGRMKSVASAKVMPFRLTKLRDKVKRLWDELP